jgi:prolyl oligopeptidase
MYVQRIAMMALVAGIFLGPVRAVAGDDPYLWLEDAYSPRALDWVNKQNERSLAVLEADPRFEPMRHEALSILTSEARIPDGQIHAGNVYNFWQDETHVRGLWRRASVASYRAGKPAWETLIDYDALAASEGQNWVAESRNCLEPEYRHCMIELSHGGKDAAVWREFDVEKKAFVEGGFVIPEAKTFLSWVDADTLLVGTNRGPGTLTDSGYARTIVRLERGTKLADAPVVFEGTPSDVAVVARAEQGSGETHVFLERAVSFFESEYHYRLERGGKPVGDIVRLPWPLNTDLRGVLDGRAILNLREAWDYRDANYGAGEILAYDLASGDVERVFAPTASQAVQNVGVGATTLVVQYLEDVSGRAARMARGKDGSWRATPIAVPDKGVVRIISAGGGTDDLMLSFQSLTDPNTLYYVRASDGRTEPIMQAPAFYDASDVVVEQRFAVSKDGTRIPYYIAGKREVLAKGNAPTVQYGYGGFLQAIVPVYYEDPGRPQQGGLAGKMWLSRGGVLVISNIRGGSEYGPAWHQAAMREKHQNAIDDFVAVSRALIDSGVTSPAKLGAIGRSNGGLLMGAVLTQHPELYAAIDIGVPLFDMRRYTKLGAGASWIAEYGDPDVPADWAFMSKYSPYQNLRAGQPYPEVFIYTSTADDRVHPGHARKATAKLEALGYHVLYYENTEGGHGGTANQDQLAFRTALEYAYFAHELMGEAR